MADHLGSQRQPEGSLRTTLWAPAGVSGMSVLFELWLGLSCVECVCVNIMACSDTFAFLGMSEVHVGVSWPVIITTDVSLSPWGLHGHVLPLCRNTSTRVYVCTHVS